VSDQYVTGDLSWGENTYSGISTRRRARLLLPGVRRAGVRRV